MTQFTIISLSDEGDGWIDLDQASVLSGMHPQLILQFVRAGYVQSVGPDAGGMPFFDEEGVLRLRRIESLRSGKGVSLRAVRFIVQLLDRLEAAEREVRLLRERLR